MPDIKIFSPDALGKPLGQYSQITRVKASEFVFIAGQVGADRDGKMGEDFDAQCTQVYANIETALNSVGGGWGNRSEERRVGKEGRTRGGRDWSSDVCSSDLSSARMRSASRSASIRRSRG